MIKTKKTSYPPLNMGTSLMLVIFIVLCMIIFSVLSLSSALKDQKDSYQNAKRTQAYYDAGNRAEDILAQIDDALYGLTDYHTCIEKLQTIDTLSIMDSDNSLFVSYSIPMNENECLEVVLAIHPEDEKKYTIVTWKQHSTSEWDGDQSLPVFGNDKD